jgi:GNAT superfamily N-acetyltransferase
MVMQTPVRAASGSVDDRGREARMEGEFALPGGELSVRPVSAADREGLGAMLSRLSARTIYERFHAPYPRVPAWALAGMVEADHDEKEALVAVVGEEIVGHAMYVRGGARDEAEFAVLVEDGWQSLGVGRRLLAELALAARSRGIDLFTGTVLGENRRALEVFSAVFPGMRYGVSDGAYAVRAPLRPAPHEAAGERVA